MENTFHSVWYRSSEKGLFELLAFKDSGTLTVRDRRIEFRGAKRLVIKDILELSCGKQGADFFNNWVRIDYDDGYEEQTAFFADGGWLGWRGIFGGTRRIYDAVRETSLAIDADG
jgi:hypothetical protein